jgi:hypothetical protein
MELWPEVLKFLPRQDLSKAALTYEILRLLSLALLSQDRDLHLAVSWGTLARMRWRK